ncbi:MAG: response regulator transcription factor [Paucibacter sp.]|nr:response regulator transcription factor [Roseateles sp.]
MPCVYLLRSCEPALAKARDVVAGMAGWQLIGASQHVGEAGAALQTAEPDILACDLRLADGRVEQLARHCHAWRRRPRILLLTETANDARVFDALRLGANAYCLVEADGRGLEQGLRRLTAWRADMSPGIAQRSLALLGLPRSRSFDALSHSAAGDQTPLGSAPGLARCEQHLLSLLASGMLASEIARAWGMPESEIERRIATVYRRLHALLRQSEAEPLEAAAGPIQAAGGAVSAKLGRAASFS